MTCMTAKIDMRSGIYVRRLVQGTRRKIAIYHLKAHDRFLTPEVLERIIRKANKHNWKNVFLQQDDYMGETLEMVNSYQMMTNYDHGLSGYAVAFPDEWEYKNLF